jgi:hypothetical protein
MIDTNSMGIPMMYQIQRDKCFPLPTYDLNTMYRVKVIVYGKILDKNYDEEWGWEYKADVIKFEKTNIIKQTGDYFYTESFELGNIKTIKVDEDTWNTLDALHDKYKDQLDKVFDEWKKKEDFIRDKCMEELWKILNKEL